MRPAIGVPVAEVNPDAIGVCLCPLNELFHKGHRHSCLEHRICADCIEDYEEDE